jgi:hypothetical protein
MSEPARQEIAPHHASAEVVAADAGSLMAVISRAAADPNTDVDKLERLMGLYERITDRSAEQSYHDAMNAAQEEMRPIAADANNPQTKSKYASYAALDRALRPIYTRHGFSISFDTADGAPVDHVRVVAEVAHRDGFKKRPHLDMPADGKGAKGGDVMTKTHAIGAAVTYGKRYLLGMVFNIAVGDDDDGNSNGGRGQSRACQDHLAAINMAEGLDGLRDWRAQHFDRASKQLHPDELKVVVELWNRRLKAAKAAQPEGAQ